MKISTLNKILSIALLLILSATLTATILVFANQKNIYVKMEYKTVEVPMQVWDTRKDEQVKIILPDGKEILSNDLKLEESSYSSMRYTLYY